MSTIKTLFLARNIHLSINHTVPDAHRAKERNLESVIDLQMHVSGLWEEIKVTYRQRENKMSFSTEFPGRNVKFFETLFCMWTVSCRCLDNQVLLSQSIKG